MPKEKVSHVGKYRTAWESDPELKAWISADPSDNKKAYCKYCKNSLNAKQSTLLVHGKSDKHKKSEKKFPAGSSRKIPEILNQSISINRKLIELKIAAFIAEHSSINSIDHLGHLIKSLDPSSEVLKDIKLHRTKSTALIVNVIAPCLLNELLADVAQSKFSLIIDESTAIDCTNMLYIMIKYYSESKKRIITTFYRLIEIEHGDDLYLTLTNKLLQLDNLKLENLIGIGVDGANVKTDEINSLDTTLKSQNKEIVIINCVCHSLHLAVENAFKTLPRNLDFLIKESFNWFSQSTKRQNEYKKIYELLTDKKTHKLEGTRWLARYHAITKIIEHWDALGLHFTTAREKEQCYVADLLFDMFSDKSNYLYLEFLSTPLESFSKVFQSETVNPLKLMENLNLLLLYNLRILVSPVQLQKTPMKDLVNFKFMDYVKGCINFEESFNEAAKSIERNKLVEIRTRCKDFLVELCKQIQKIAMNSILQQLHLLSPEFATSVEQPDIKHLASSFLTLCSNTDTTISQWKLIPELKWTNVDNVENFWIEVANNNDASGKPRFKNLSNMTLALLSLPFSNAAVERAFSKINIVQNKLRNRFSVSSVDSIMRVRWHLMNMNNGCADFQPSEDMMQEFNSEDMYQIKKEDEDIMEIFSE